MMETLTGIEKATREAVADIFTLDGPQDAVDATIVDGLLAQGFAPATVNEILKNAHARTGFND